MQLNIRIVSIPGEFTKIDAEKGAWMMKVIGITGGIGSGKSLVAGILKEKYGAYIVNTDRIAKEQMEPGGASYPGVVGYFGEGILSEDKRIDRGKLSKVVFCDKEKLQMINRLTHPNVLEVVKEEIKGKRNEGVVPYFVIETALMIESGYDYVCDEVWYVSASEESRRNRLMNSRNYSDEKIDAIMASQSKDEDFRRKSSKVIENNGDAKSLEKQIELVLNSTTMKSLP